jgi:protein-tyrosine-phosphatase
MGTPGYQHGTIVPENKLQPIKSVLFVCTANQCRSPMAEVLFRDLVSTLDLDSDWCVASAGCWARPNNAATQTAVAVIQDRGIDLSEHLSQPVTEALLDSFNLILCMEEDHKRFIQRNFSSAREKTFLLYEMIGKEEEIWDPIGMSQNAYENTANEMLGIMSEGFEKISMLAGTLT